MQAKGTFLGYKENYEEWLRNTENDTPLNRANLLEEIVRTFYDFSKFERPGEQELMAEMALNDKDWLEFLKQLLNTTIK